MQGDWVAHITARMEFKDRLKAARKKAGLTQAQLAKDIGVDQSSISDLERGKSQSSSYAYQIATACGVDAKWLITGKEESKNLYTLSYTVDEAKPDRIADRVETYQTSDLSPEVKDLVFSIIRDFNSGLLTKENIDTLLTFEQAISAKNK